MVLIKKISDRAFFEKKCVEEAGTRRGR